MKSDFSNASASFKKRNPSLFTTGTAGINFSIPKPGGVLRRMRQDSKPLLNQLETEWLAVLKERYPGVTIHAQAIRFKLASGAWYKADLCVFENEPGCKSGLIAYETKCFKGKNADRGILALKCAAHQFPEVCFVLVWKDSAGQWQEQIVKP